MVQDIRATIERAQACGLIQLPKKRKYNPEKHDRAHISREQAKINAAVGELLGFQPDPSAPVRAGHALPYGTISTIAKKHGVDSQSLRNALGRKRGK